MEKEFRPGHFRAMTIIGDSMNVTIPIQACSCHWRIRLFHECGGKREGASLRGTAAPEEGIGKVRDEKLSAR